MLHNQTQLYEYIIIGAGPAALTAIPNLLKSGVKPESILWLDPEFKVGDFGTKLSKGSSVPGNTTVENYKKVNYEILAILANYKTIQPPAFAIDAMANNYVCTLKTAAEPLQFFTKELRTIVPSVMTKVSHIDEVTEGLKVTADKAYISKRVIVATGSIPRTLNIPVPTIDPNDAFIQSELVTFLKNNPTIKKIAVVGSSHSAALATMHLLQAGLSVKQFMNKEYKYAVTVKTETTHYTQYDNTGLKGDVAKFTKEILSTGKYQEKLQRFIGKDHQEIQTLLTEQFFDCSHAVVAIGYTPTPGIKVNGAEITTLKHNSKTTAFYGINGLFGIGIAYPQQVTDISGEVEMAVGIGKFWSTTSNANVLTTWKENTAGEVFYRSNNLVSLFRRTENGVNESSKPINHKKTVFEYQI